MRERSLLRIASLVSGQRAAPTTTPFITPLQFRRLHLRITFIIGVSVPSIIIIMIEIIS